MPISDDEAARILRQVSEGVERPKPTITFEIGEQVKVADGPFASFTGQVEEVEVEWKEWDNAPAPDPVLR